MKDIGWEYYNDYPRLYPLATTMEITREEIDEMTGKVWGNWKLNLKYNKNETENIIRTILAKLNHRGEALSDLSKYKNKEDDELVNSFGIRQLEILKAIMS